MIYYLFAFCCNNAKGGANDFIEASDLEILFNKMKGNKYDNEYGKFDFYHIANRYMKTVMNFKRIENCYVLIDEDNNNKKEK